MPEMLTSTLGRPSFGNAESLFLFDCTMSQHRMNHESSPVSYLCVNTKSATKETLISHECISVIDLETVLCS